MEKVILMSIHSNPLINILNKDKLREIRKKFPKDYRGWIYLYCCKGGAPVFIPWEFEVEKQEDGTYKALTDFERGNGKVVARFWCDKVEEIKLNLAARFFTKSMNEEELLKQSCLTSKELENYLWSNICCGYAIHINDLQVFDRPKEISEFYNYLNCSHSCFNCLDNHYVKKCNLHKLTRAPQSWCYVEVDS